MKDKWDFIQIIEHEVNKFAAVNKGLNLSMNIYIKRDSMGYYKVDII